MEDRNHLVVSLGPSVPAHGPTARSLAEIGGIALVSAVASVMLLEYMRPRSSSLHAQVQVQPIASAHVRTVQLPHVQQGGLVARHQVPQVVLHQVPRTGASAPVWHLSSHSKSAQLDARACWVGVGLVAIGLFGAVLTRRSRTWVRNGPDPLEPLLLLGPQREAWAMVGTSGEKKDKRVDAAGLAWEAALAESAAGRGKDTTDEGTDDDDMSITGMQGSKKKSMEPSTSTSVQENVTVNNDGEDSMAESADGPTDVSPTEENVTVGDDGKGIDLNSQTEAAVEMGAATTPTEEPTNDEDRSPNSAEDSKAEDDAPVRPIAPGKKFFMDLSKAIEDATQQVQRTVKEGIERDALARQTFSEEIEKAFESTAVVRVANAGEAFKAVSTAISIQVKERFGEPDLSAIEDVVPLAMVEFVSNRTKGYAGDISPKRAQRLLRKRTDAVLIDIRDLQAMDDVEDEDEGAEEEVADLREDSKSKDRKKGVPDLRLGARGKGIRVKPDKKKQVRTTFVDADGVTREMPVESKRQQKRQQQNVDDDWEDVGAEIIDENGDIISIKKEVVKQTEEVIDIGEDGLIDIGDPNVEDIDSSDPAKKGEKGSKGKFVPEGDRRGSLVRAPQTGLVSARRRAVLSGQADTIAELDQVAGGKKVVIILDQDGIDSVEMARLLKAKGIDRPFVVRGGYDAWADQGLRTKEGEEYDSSPWQVLAEELEALFEDTENSVEIAEELWKSPLGKSALVGGAVITTWAVFFNVKLAFEILAAVLIIDQLGSDFSRRKVTVWEKTQNIQKRLETGAKAASQVDRLRKDLATVLKNVKEREKEAQKIQKESAARMEEIASLTGSQRQKAEQKEAEILQEERKRVDREQKRVDLLREEILQMAGKEDSVLKELKDFLSTAEGKGKTALGVTLGGLIVTNSDELFNGAVALLFIKIALDRLTNRAEEKNSPLAKQFEKMMKGEDKQGDQKKKPK